MSKSRDEINSEIKSEIRVFVDAIGELSKVNRLTGIWDNRRFQACKRPVEEVNLEFLYKSEKLSRKNVELRAVYRTQLDVSLEKILELWKEKAR